jgi:hypothetical protein
MSRTDLIDLWLDDMRPAPMGWLHVKTVEDAKLHLEAGRVRNLSLDHDLGACKDCLKGRSPEQWLHETNYTQMPNCDHFGTGYTLVCWMEETGRWSREIPRIHTANPVGRKNMAAAIAKAIRNGQWQSQ